MSAAVTLEITVTDGNDNAPTFLNLPYVVMLEEGTTGPLVVLVAMATDLDEGDNGEVDFILIGGEGVCCVLCVIVEECDVMCALVCRSVCG